MRSQDAEPVYSAPRWLRRLTVQRVIGALAIAGFVAVTSPLWGNFLPWRWRYSSEIRRGERIIEVIARFKAINGRLPSYEDVARALPVEDWPCSECYDPHGETFELMLVGGFDESVWYDSRTGRFRRSP